MKQLAKYTSLLLLPITLLTLSCKSGDTTSTSKTDENQQRVTEGNASDTSAAEQRVTEGNASDTAQGKQRATSGSASVTPAAEGSQGKLYKPNVIFRAHR